MRSNHRALRAWVDTAACSEMHVANVRRFTSEGRNRQSLSCGCTSPLDETDVGKAAAVGSTDISCLKVELAAAGQPDASWVRRESAKVKITAAPKRPLVAASVTERSCERGRRQLSRPSRSDKKPWEAVLICATTHQTTNERRLMGQLGVRQQTVLLSNLGLRAGWSTKMAESALDQSNVF